MRIRRYLFSCGFVTLGAIATACEARVVDIGTHDAGVAPAATSVEAGNPKGSAYGCAEWNDEELYELRAGSCPGFCPEPGATQQGATRYALASKKEILAATSGEWLFCRGTLGPNGAVGVEFAPGCRLFFLRRDAEGKLTRGTERAFQASYDIYFPRPPNATARIDVNIDDERTITFDVEVDRCPERVRLVYLRADSIEMARPPGTSSNPGNATR
ncbi:MAG: hypothetical protein JST00_44640 [Deltaproteobacteria bacterium]|nr:hypothetical protein [Deltaproteobacteria bacterium]